ncbi:MAG: LPP20 family lipoprotein [Deltaproteobacteria bacterium]|nr:LPP20 family lipoprotein [Deltaproteobacteria bacterium]
MRRAPIGLMSVFIPFALMACGGGKTPKPGMVGVIPADAPEWVHRGSLVKQGSIFGVGLANGIKNPSLLRQTAQNRARNEIQKILEVYTASLMKDFQESASANGVSSESQMVSSAVKTFTAGLLKGTELKDQWMDTQGTAYALVELNFARQKEIASADVGDGQMKGWLDENGPKVLGGMEGDQGKPPSDDGPVAEEGGEEEAPEPPADERPEPPPPPPAAKKPEVAPVVGGDPPAWTKGSKSCDAQKYLCGVGTGGDQRASDIEARAELARIFQANIKSVATSFQGAASKVSSSTGESWEELQKVTQFSMVSTEKVVTMSSILSRWDDGKGKKYSLAVIDRNQAANALRDQIEQRDSLIETEMGRARDAEDKLARFKSVRRAVAALAEREAMNADLRVIDLSGRGIPPPHDIGELLGMLEGAAAELSIGVALNGTGAQELQACMEERLTAKGYQVEAKSLEDEDTEASVAGSFDVLLKGTVKADKRDKIAGSEVVNVSLTVKVINGKTNKIVKTVTASKKSSRGSDRAAAATAVVQLCAQKMNDIVSAIDSAMGR